MSDEQLTQTGQDVLRYFFRRLAGRLSELPPDIDGLSWTDSDTAGYRMLLRVVRPDAPLYPDVQLKARLEWEKAQKATSDRFKLYLSCRVGKISRPVLGLSCTAGGVWHGQVAELKGPHLTGTKEEVWAWAGEQLRLLELADKLPALPGDCA